MADVDCLSPSDFLVNSALYSPITFQGDQTSEMTEILYFAGTYDSQCTKCGREATFKVQAREMPKELILALGLKHFQQLSGQNPFIPASAIPAVHVLTAYCARNSTHQHTFILQVESHSGHDVKGKERTYLTVEKIGQYPSFANLNLARVKKYKTVLDKHLLAELNKAIGLAAHDVGIGAYAYLRRVFEYLIEDAHKCATMASDWNEERYKNSRMLEKIGMVKDHLPSFLVQHPQMYGLLSKGIHELSEEECLSHFHTLLIATELILDERIDRREKERKIAEAKKALGKATAANS